LPIANQKARSALAALAADHAFAKQAPMDRREEGRNRDRKDRLASTAAIAE
jgi:hypothetical protein